MRWQVDQKKIVGRVVRDSLDPDAQPTGNIAGRWISPDPLSEEFPSWSPYNYAMNNPVNMIDPDGRAAFSPIYGTNGQFLGTDDQGLQGKAIVMNESNFKQGMKHEEAVKNDLAPNGENEYLEAIPDYSNYVSFYNHYNGLSDRPDYDGIVTDSEARQHWNGKTGESLFIDVNKLDLSPLTTNSFGEDGRLRYNFFTSLNSNTRTGRVHGTLSMRLRNRDTGEVGFFRDNNGFFDTYDFNDDGRFFRDLTTKAARQLVGEGTGFGFIPYGNNPRVSVTK